jgi:hypothetical protein
MAADRASTVPSCGSMPGPGPDRRALTVRACNWRTRSVCASSVLATTIRPLVSLSSRCTMPARGTASMPGTWWSSAFISVPLQLPLPGWTTSPAGLLMTSSVSSSKTTSSGMSSGCSAAGAHLQARTSSTSPPSTLRLGSVSGLPSTCTSRRGPSPAGGCGNAAATVRPAPGRADGRHKLRERSGGPVQFGYNRRHLQ